MTTVHRPSCRLLQNMKPFQLVATVFANIWGWITPKYRCELQNMAIKQKLMFQTHFLGFHVQFEQGINMHKHHDILWHIAGLET